MSPGAERKIQIIFFFPEKNKTFIHHQKVLTILGKLLG